MENASKALIMAATILLGVMIIAIGVYLFSSYAQYSSSTYKKIEQAQIDQFNSQFLKYYGSEEITLKKYDSDISQTKMVSILCTAHDIISLANLAQKNNQYYEIENEGKGSEASNYIQIKLEKVDDNIEKWTEEKKIDFLKNSTYSVTINGKVRVKNRYYYINSEPEINSGTKRVYCLEFKEYKYSNDMEIIS